MLTKDEINKAKELLTKQTGAIGSEYHLGTYLLECSKLVPKLLDTVERQAEAIDLFINLTCRDENCYRDYVCSLCSAQEKVEKILGEVSE